MTSEVGSEVGEQGKSGLPPSPAAIFEIARGYQNSYVLKTGVELDVFTAIAKGSHTAAEISKAVGASARGVRILCDALTVLGFLVKSGNSYSLTPDSAAFLDSRKQAYLGKAFQFLMHPMNMKNIERFSEAVRKGAGGGARDGLQPNDPVWVDFARGMAPMMVPAAMAIASRLKPLLAGKAAPKVLDIAAGHGIFGITVAGHIRSTQIYAVDWASVLEVARENARLHSVGDRHHLIPGSAFDVEYGSGYDAVVLTNFLHHFDVATNERLLKKVANAMNPGAHLVILEFVPNEDRVSPAVQALFSVTMLSNTAAGDAYTFAELEKMCSQAGFAGAKQVALEEMPQTLVLAHRV
jgi:2-polyprenyl-3-methyl-5-hydroxy-6-metoxy-1,4-benzoquinol methylase